MPVTPSILDVSPGEQLRNELEHLFPDQPDRSCFVSDLDNGLIADGEFAALVYRSSINYMLRRLITSAEYLKRKFDVSSYPPGMHVNEIRRYIRDYTRIPVSKQELILALLLACLAARDKETTLRTKSRLRREAGRRGLSCYICGNALDYSDPTSSQAEHVWPRAMGGSSDETNLRMACQHCNELKWNYIDGSDYHFEEICLVTDEGDQNFSAEFRDWYQVAVLAESDFACSLCGKPAAQVGALAMVRRNPTDSWHFLNIMALCGRCMQRFR
jgi:5-methylcytosine-specific restriction endonuclease McrA